MMFISTVIFAAMSYTIPISRRLYHVVTTLVVAFATLSYYAMVSKFSHTFITNRY